MIVALSLAVALCGGATPPSAATFVRELGQIASIPAWELRADLEAGLVKVGIGEGGSFKEPVLMTMGGETIFVIPASDLKELNSDRIDLLAYKYCKQKWARE